jgi:hypothetical protein
MAKFFIVDVFLRDVRALEITVLSMRKGGSADARGFAEWRRRGITAQRIEPAFSRIEGEEISVTPRWNGERGVVYRFESSEPPYYVPPNLLLMLQSSGSNLQHAYTNAVSL